MSRALCVPLPAPPELLFEVIADDPMSFLLDSALPGERQGRYAFLGSRPGRVFWARGRGWAVREGARVRRGRGDPFLALRDVMASRRAEPLAGAPPLLAGAVGWVAYEAGRVLERLVPAPVLEPGLPDLWFGVYDAVAACDLVRRELWVPETALGRALLARLAAVSPRPRPRRPFRLTSPMRTSLDADRHRQAVAAIRDSIARGEIYQANLTRRLTATWAGDPYDLFRRLREASPAPFAAYFNAGPVRVCSTSPERFLRVAGRRAETRPIKGTRPRGASPQGDRALALELVRSAKDAAEHVMIVDLERNDLGRVCEYGSVVVSELAALEVFPQVFHLTSTVEGRLRRGLTSVDALRALVPGGSVTGAPKIRAQGLLASVESGPRGLYTGAIGYLADAGGCDFAIAIRTAVLHGRRFSYGIGGGIVADSDPAAEWVETGDKAAGLLRALAGPGGPPAAGPPRSGAPLTLGGSSRPA